LNAIAMSARKLHEKHLEKHLQDKEVTKKINRMMAFIGIMGPLSTFIQVVHIFNFRTAAGISIYSWIGYILVSICWFGYGFFYKDKPIMIVNTLSLFVNSFMIFGFVLYR